jgi:hypothetical protein
MRIIVRQGQRGDKPNSKLEWPDVNRGGKFKLGDVNVYERASSSDPPID